jgi:membrane-bound lytic murein transglycosylase B
MHYASAQGRCGGGHMLHLPHAFKPVAMAKTAILLLTVLSLCACTDTAKKDLPLPTPTTAPAPPSTAVAAPPATTPAPTPTPSPPLDQQAAFAAQTAQSTGIPVAEIQSWLAQARYQPSIIRAITRPAESMTWASYRPIFITDARIAAGSAFMAAHHIELAKVEAETGVPAEYITAIIGVETYYGTNTGSYRVLDALYTLAFYYPKRQDFFRGELSNLFALAKEEKLDLATLRGSYAGAMGWGQFMPSSYRKYAKDGDGDGRRDLLSSPADAIASVANYFVGYGWQRGQPVFVRAQADVGAAPFVPENSEPTYTLAQLAAKGYRPAETAPDLPVTLVTLDGADGPETWIGYQNYYVITRYNRSPLYAMAVQQLAQALKAREAVAQP